MSEVKLLISNLDSAAFEDEPHLEIARILKTAAERVAKGETFFTLRDINGNAVGKIEISY